MYNTCYVSFIEDGSIPKNAIIKISLNTRVIETEGKTSQVLPLFAGLALKFEDRLYTGELRYLEQA